MASHAAAASYTKALFSLAKERGQVEAVGRELETVAQTLRDTPSLREFFGRPWVAAAAKRNVAAELGTRLGLSKLGGDFLALLAARGRADLFDAIVAEYGRLTDVAAGRVRARVRTAVPLTAAERTALATHLGRALQAYLSGASETGGGPQVVVEEEVDKGLLGGFVAQIGSFVVDGSLDGQLARLRERLAHG